MSKKKVRHVQMLVKNVHNKTIEIKLKLLPHATNTRWDQTHPSELSALVMVCYLLGGIRYPLQFLSIFFFNIVLCNTSIEHMSIAAKSNSFLTKNGHFTISLLFYCEFCTLLCSSVNSDVKAMKEEKKVSV